MHLDFPYFYREDFDSQILNVEYYFEVNAISNDDRPKTVALHFNGREIQWHQSFIRSKNRVAVTQEEYVVTMRIRFGSHGYDNPLADLRNLKQVSILQQYLNAFEVLYLTIRIREDQDLSFFLSGLKDSLLKLVKMFKKKTLIKAYSFTKL